MEKPLIRTVGHSTRPIEVFVEMLQAHSIERLIDVRTIPKSKRNPQFSGEALERSLHAAGIAYEHMSALGGLRHPRKDSRNTGWRNQSFRGYADYMQTAEFASALEALGEIAAHEATAIMCAEAVPWRCHRMLVSDALAARGYRVEHIMGAAKSNPHTMTSFARTEGTSIMYPAGPESHLSRTSDHSAQFGDKVRGYPGNSILPISIPDSELTETFVRASGPGGQNVNKVSSAVQLRFDIGRSPSLPDDVRRRLLALAGNRATQDGVLILTSRVHRTQEANRAEARARLNELVARAQVAPKTRRSSRPTLGSKIRRLTAKSQRSSSKKLRSRPTDE